MREIALLKELEHPNVVQLLDVVHAEDKLYMVFEYLNMDLKKHMDDVAEETRAADPKADNLGLPEPLVKVRISFRSPQQQLATLRIVAEGFE